MIIDTHAQLFTKGFLDRVKGGEFPGLEDMGYARFFAGVTPDDTLDDMDAAGVDLSVVVAVDAESTANFKVANELVAEEVGAAGGRLIGFAGVDPHKGKAAVDELERAVREMGMKGVKFICHLNELSPDDQLFYPIYEAAQSLGVPVLHHTGTHYHFGYKIKHCRPVAIDEVACDFPSLTVIAAHFGWPWADEAIAVAQRNPNVYLNVAGWAPKHWPEVVLRYMNGPLRHKFLFGSDHPLLTRKRILDEMRALPLREGVFQAITEENPRRVLGLG